MNQSTKTISPLRQRMIEDMTLRKLGPSTQTGYLRAVVKLNQYLKRSPDAATAEDLRLFQLHMVQQGDSSLALTVEKHSSLRHSHPAAESPSSINRQMERIHHAQFLPFTEITPSGILLSP